MKLGMSLRWKMVAGSTAIITLLLVVIGTFVIRQVSQIEYRNAVKANQTLAQAMSDRFNENSDAFVHQIDFVTLDGEISDIMEKGGSSQAEIYSNRKELRSVITLRSIAMDAISGVYLYDINGTLVTKWEKTPNREGAYRLPNTTDISRFTPDGRVTSEFLDGHLVYNRAVRTLETRKIVGYITFLYDDRVLKERLDVIAGNSNNFLGLYDSVDDVLICCDNIDKEAYLQALADQDLSDAQGGITITVDGIGQMLLCSNEVMNDGWYFLSAVSNDDIYEMQSLLMLMILSFALIAVLLILCITALNHTIITGPIAHIMDAVKKIQNEDYDITLDVHTGDEIEILADNLNIMARRIDELVNQNLKANLAYKEMQITQLQHQIKPHFLYNTLECINALSQMGRFRARLPAIPKYLPDGPYRGSAHHHRRIRQADEKPYKRRNFYNGRRGTGLCRCFPTNLSDDAGWTVVLQYYRGSAVRRTAHPQYDHTAFGRKCCFTRHRPQCPTGYLYGGNL